MQNTINNETYSKTPKTRNGLIQTIRMVKSIGKKWAKIVNLFILLYIFRLDRTERGYSRESLVYSLYVTVV